MKKLLLIMGDLAAGKSVFADILSKRYRIAAFKKDAIKEVLGDTIGFASREENLKLSAAAAELMLFQFSEFARVGQDMILESNFRQAELDKLYQAAERSGYDVLTLFLCGEPEILHKRYLNRMTNENRHPVHLSVVFDTLEDFKNCLVYARKVNALGNVLRIDVNDFSYQTDGTLLTKIDEFIGK